MINIYYLIETIGKLILLSMALTIIYFIIRAILNETIEDLEE